MELDQDTQRFIVELALRLGLFLLGSTVSPFVGRMLPNLIKVILVFMQPYLQYDTQTIYDKSIKPFDRSLVFLGTLLFVSLCLSLLIKYQELYTFLGFFVYLTLSLSIVWLTSRITQRVIRQIIINFVQRVGGEVNEVVLVFETITNIVIVLLAIVIFAGGLRLNLLALTASLGISGVAIAFAGQQALGRLIGTLELYLDRPYVPGEYIRVTFNQFKEDVYGRVESIGLRSTKIRTVAKNTLIIVPNSIMAGMHVENISRGKKVMAMLSLTFTRRLKEGEKSLVRQVIEDTCRAYWGIEKSNTRIEFTQPEGKAATQARLSFFVTGSSENSLNLRKRLLEMANLEIASKLLDYNLEFTTPEPLVYIDSPISI